MFWENSRIDGSPKIVYVMDFKNNLIRVLRQKDRFVNWRNVKNARVKRIDRVVAEFEIWPNDELPFAKFRIRILEGGVGDFTAVANVAIRNPTTGPREGAAGLGRSIDEALEDALNYFFLEIEQHKSDRPLEIGDSAWLHPDDF